MLILTISKINVECLMFSNGENEQGAGESFHLCRNVMLHFKSGL